MKKKKRKWWLWGLAVGSGAALALGFRTPPVNVDVAAVARGGLAVTVDEDGETRVRERYVISAPLAGRLLRTGLREGDRVEAGATVVASIDPGAPGLLDTRSIAISEGRLRSAEAEFTRSTALHSAAVAEEERCRTTFLRKKALFEGGAGSEDDFEDARFIYDREKGNREASESAVAVAQFERDQAEAALLHITQAPDDEPAGDWRFEIQSPVTGRVLRVIEESRRMVEPGAELIEIGDPTDLEVVVDVLSRDAVRIRRGAPVNFVHWGGEDGLAGVVRLVEPSGFTKVSALGVEEQRVNVIIDFDGGTEIPETLGDAYRVEAEITVWEEEDVLKVPMGALFRGGDGGWLTYVVASGTAMVRSVDTGAINGVEAEVLAGLKVGDMVVLNPDDRVREGSRIRVR